MRLSLKGEKRKKKKKARLCPFFSIKKKKVLGELDSSGQFRFSHVTETGHLLQFQTPLGDLGSKLSMDKQISPLHSTCSQSMVLKIPPPQMHLTQLTR